MAQMIGIGTLGKDAEARYTANGDAVVNLNLAFPYGKKAQGEKYRPSQWVRASLWGKRGESLAPYLTRGTKVYVVLDDVNVREWEKDDGAKGYSLEGRVSTIEFAGGGEERGEGREEREQEERPSKPAKTGGGVGDMNDDIPF